MSHFSVYIVYV